MVMSHFGILVEGSTQGGLANVHLGVTAQAFTPGVGRNGTVLLQATCKWVGQNPVPTRM